MTQVNTNFQIVFDDGVFELGKLFKNDAGKLEFEGNAEESALVLFKHLFEQFEKLKVSQPVIILPERKPASMENEFQLAEEWYEELGYNQAIDDLKRLNGITS